MRSSGCAGGAGPTGDDARRHARGGTPRHPVRKRGVSDDGHDRQRRVTRCRSTAAFTQQSHNSDVQQWREHVGPGGDYHLGYREKAECERAQANDPVRVIGDLLPLETRTRIEAAVEREVAAAFEYAETSSFPASTELMTDIFTEEADEFATSRR